MESTEYTFDELLCQSLLLFRQSRFYDNCQESEVEAYKMLEEAKLLINKTHDSVDMAKWGCAFECLVQKYYINGDTDNILGDIDVTLINFWKKVVASMSESFPFICGWGIISCYVSKISNRLVMYVANGLCLISYLF